MKGTVRRYITEKGYGFIMGEDDHEYFVHQSFIDMQGFRKLVANQEVEFQSVEGKSGKEAHQVKVI